MNSNQNPYAMQDAFYADEAEYAEAVESFSQEFPDWVESVNPDRFVSEADYNAATPQEWADLQFVLDWESFEGMGS